MKYFRLKAIPFFIAIYGLLSFYLFLFGKSHFKSYLEEYLSQLRGGEVSIGKLSLYPFSRTLELESIEVARRSLPMKNLLTIDKASIHYSLGAVFAKKLHFNDIRLEGISHNSNRSRAARPILIDKEERTVGTAPALFDVVASSLYNHLKDQIRDNPLRYINKLASGQDISSKTAALSKTDVVGELQKQKEALIEKAEKWKSRTKDWEKTVLNLVSQWQALTKDFRNIASIPRNRVQTLTLELRKAQENLGQDLGELQKEVSDSSAFESILESEIIRVQKSLGIPRESGDDFSNLLMGPKIIEFMERAAFWIDWTRNNLLTGTPDVTTQKRDRGETVHFGKPGALPNFTVLKLNVNSSARNKFQGDIQATIENFTSDPSILGKPFRGEGTAHFSDLEIKDMMGKFEIDHTGSEQKESFHLKLSSFPIENWKVLDEKGARLEIFKALIGGEFDLQFVENKISGKGTFDFSHIDSKATSTAKPIEEAVQSALGATPRITVTCELQGEVNRPQLTITSNFGKNLALSLRETFKHQIGAVEENVKHHLIQEYEPQRAEIEKLLSELHTTTLLGLERHKKTLEQILRLADKFIK